MSSGHPIELWQKSCVHAVRIGGEILKEYCGKVVAHEKAPRDLVTQADLASQKAIELYLKQLFPEHLFLGEESDAATLNQVSENRDGRVRWVIDPLDGTTNFVHQLPNYCVSVAVERDGVIWAGAVYNPVSDECFHAGRGRGAWLNHDPIKASSCSKLNEALLAVGFSAGIKRGSVEVRRFEELLYEARAIRRLGSAALNLCYVAAGRLDGFFATSVKPWDVAAGVLLIEEAGGIVTGIDGSPFDLIRAHVAAAATREVHAQMGQHLFDLR
jgi:myo-inositol-1(or 4)-monophosphatase